MKFKVLLVSVGVLVAIGLFSVILFEKEPLPLVVVIMTKQGFEPATFDVKKGQAVEFRNTSTDIHFWPASDLHPTHDIYPEFDPREPIAPGESWTFVFKRKGTWKFHDHLRASLRGTIQVLQ